MRQLGGACWKLPSALPPGLAARAGAVAANVGDDAVRAAAGVLGGVKGLRVAKRGLETWFCMCFEVLESSQLPLEDLAKVSIDVRRLVWLADLGLGGRRG